MCNMHNKKNAISEPREKTHEGSNDVATIADAVIGKPAIFNIS